MKKSHIRTYTELSKLNTFKERYEYLRLDGNVSEETFGFDRILNQKFYRSAEWKRIRDEVIVRDLGCDLGVEGYDINTKIYIHHMNPITKMDLLDQTEFLLNPEYLICCSFNTHQAIHYGSEDLTPQDPVIRTKNDTCPWKK